MLRLLLSWLALLLLSSVGTTMIATTEAWVPTFSSSASSSSLCRCRRRRHVPEWTRPLPPPKRQRPRLSLYEDEDASFSAQPLPLTAADRERLSALRDRFKTILIMILDPMLPGQRLEFGSPDPKFRKLVDYLIQQQQSNEKKKKKAKKNTAMGMIGLNPHTGKPISMGVTLSIQEIRTRGDVCSVVVQAKELLEVQGEPWLDETQSFYFSDVELLQEGTGASSSSRISSSSSRLDPEQQKHADRMYGEIPALVERWLACLYKSEKATPESMKPRLDDIGPMPNTLGKRALWTAALVNPLPALGVCFEVRPAMLACSNDYDRINLAWAALHSSIDHLQGKRPL